MSGTRSARAIAPALQPASAAPPSQTVRMVVHSAVAMALADRVPDMFRPSSGDREGLGLLPHLRILPHFDAMLGRVPDLLTRPFLRAPAGVNLVGVDENTALVGGPEEFTVRGVGSAWILGAGRRRQVPAGTSIRFPASLE